MCDWESFFYQRIVLCLEKLIPLEYVWIRLGSNCKHKTWHLRWKILVGFIVLIVWKNWKHVLLERSKVHQSSTFFKIIIYILSRNLLFIEDIQRKNLWMKNEGLFLFKIPINVFFKVFIGVKNHLLHRGWKKSIIRLN